MEKGGNIGALAVERNIKRTIVSDSICTTTTLLLLLIFIIIINNVTSATLRNCIVHTSVHLYQLLQGLCDVAGRLRGLVGSALDQRSLPPDFETRRGHS